jgi:hypothetical protein
MICRFYWSTLLTFYVVAFPSKIVLIFFGLGATSNYKTLKDEWLGDEDGGKSELS